MKKLYIVTAYRWGSKNGHSYLLGAFDKKSKAIACAESHADYRGGKYACVVEEVILNHFYDNDEYYSKEIYRAKSVKD